MVRGAARSFCRIGRNWYRSILGSICAVVLVPAAAMAQQAAKAPPGSVSPASDSALQPVFTLPPPPFTIPGLPSIEGDWIVSVGAGAEYKPDFEGSRRYMVSPIPVFSIRRASSPERFRSPLDSASFTLFDYGGFHAGPVAKFVAARNANNFAELAGLGNVNAALEIGGFVEYFPIDWFRTRVEVRQGFFGHGGVTANLSADAIVPLSQGLIFSAGPRRRMRESRCPVKKLEKLWRLCR